MLLSIWGLAALFAVVLGVAWLAFSNKQHHSHGHGHSHDAKTDQRHKEFAENYGKGHQPNAKMLELKKKLFENLKSINSSIPEVRKRKGLKLLEIGAGPGSNLEYYPPNTKIIVADPNHHFQKFFTDNLKKHPNVELERFVVSGAENLKDVPDHSVDVVVGTFVFCHVPDLQQAYKEIQRVLVPGGKYLFAEHVLDDQLSVLRIVQKALGLFRRLFTHEEGRPDVDYGAAINKAGFATIDAQTFRMTNEGGNKHGWSWNSFWHSYIAKVLYFGVATTTGS